MGGGLFNPVLKEPHEATLEFASIFAGLLNRCTWVCGDMGRTATLGGDRVLPLEFKRWRLVLAAMGNVTRLLIGAGKPGTGVCTPLPRALAKVPKTGEDGVAARCKATGRGGGETPECCLCSPRPLRKARVNEDVASISWPETKPFPLALTSA